MAEKIGMCCACGGSFPKRMTIMHDGFEYCQNCADMLGIDEDEEDEE